MLFFPLIHVKMPTIVGILTFMSGENFMLNWVEHEKSFITSGTGLVGKHSSSPLSVVPSCMGAAESETSIFMALSKFWLLCRHHWLKNTSMDTVSYSFHRTEEAVWSGSTLFAIPSASFGCINAMFHQTFLFLRQLWQLFEVSQILEFLR